MIGKGQAFAAHDQIERQRVEVVARFRAADGSFAPQAKRRRRRALRQPQRRMVGKRRNHSVEGLEHGGQRGDETRRLGAVGGGDDQAARGLEMIGEGRLLLDHFQADRALVGVAAIEAGDAAQEGGEFAQHLGERQAPARRRRDAG